MLEFFLELFSEEIPARMQAEAVKKLPSIIIDAISDIIPMGTEFSIYSGPRRIALAAVLLSESKATQSKIRGPRVDAPEQAIEKFSSKWFTRKDKLKIVDSYYWHVVNFQERPAFHLIIERLPKALAAFPWPKSMRWGQGGDFMWVRPLRRIVCLLDGKVIPIKLGPVMASNETVGHRFMAPGALAIVSEEDWQAKLRERRVIVVAEERKQIIVEGFAEQAVEKGLVLVEDEALLDEVIGLVEWPVPLIGHIDQRFMALPPEVRELSMKVNQRYFALRDQAGQPAPFFAFVSNIETDDGGATIIAGNERVLRARLADAEHFWNQDRKHRLDEYLPKLNGVTFHAKLGTQFEHAERIGALSRQIAQLLGANDHEMQQAERAGLLAKADLVTGLVGEFPELQGVMGGYYANDAVIGAAISTHYLPKGPNDKIPCGVTSCAVALADKIDTLAAFFRIGEKPTGSGDPYALRRAALGALRIISENRLILNLYPILDKADDLVTNMLMHHGMVDVQAQSGRSGDIISGSIKVGGFGSANLNSRELFSFLIERLRVLLKSQGQRYDVLNAIFAIGEDDDIVSLLDKTKAVGEFLGTEDGGNLLTAYRRAANILKIENSKDGPHEGKIFEALLHDPAERKLNEALKNLKMQTTYEPSQRSYSVLLADLATLRVPVDAFFDAVKINADDPELRKNRLRLLAKLRDTMHQIADFSKIEG